MVNESFDTTTNLRGDKVNIPNHAAAPQNPFAVVKQTSVESTGRASTGSAGQPPQYAQVQNPYGNDAAAG